MDFGLSEDQSLFDDALRGFLADRAPVERVREIMAGEAGTDAALLRELAEQGATGILTAPEHGGSGLGLLDAALAAQAFGAAATPLSFHSACVMAPLAIWFGRVKRRNRSWFIRMI